MFNRKLLADRALCCLVKTNRTLLSLAFVSLLSLPIRAADVPNFAWVASAGGAKHDKTRCITVDAKGCSYITGEFSSESKYGAQTIKSAGDMDYFVAKLDADGKILWVRTGGGTQTDRGYGVAVDAKGNVYTTGHYQSADYFSVD